jgi:hypothetical protein
MFAFAASCSYTFDTEAPTLPFVGSVPDTPSMPHLNTKPVDGESFARAVDGRVYLVMQHTDKTWRMIPMSGDPSTEENISLNDADDVFVTWRALYLTQKPLDFADQKWTLTVRSIGESPGHVFYYADQPQALFSGGEDDVFAYFPVGKKVPGYYLQRRDESFSRIVPWAKGVDPANPFKDSAFFFDGNGDRFFDRDSDGRLVAHSTHSSLDIDLGIRPRSIGWIDSHTLVTCGQDGVRVVPIDGKTPERVLDNDQCKPGRLSPWRGYVYYDVGTAIRKTMIDGSVPPATVFEYGMNRVLTINLDGETVLYSTDPADKFVHGAGDGWLSNWRFMERGTDVYMPPNRKHIYWLEDSAQGTGAGQLMSATLSAPGVPGGTPAVLTRNTRFYLNLDDGRVLCDEDHAYAGAHNRIVVLDEARKNKQWVASSADDLSAVPYSQNDWIVDVVSGASGHDLVRVKVPSPIPPPPSNQ